MNQTDLTQIDNLLKKRLKNFATKEDLKIMKKELIDRMDEMEMNIIGTVEKHKADKTQIEELGKRVAKLEHPYD